ncbi:hypothetical protein [Agrobacterium vaccinii]|uniref:hypothetical protein n=1 Tax=Agrobacterium vaccinii TaxID=2735528 RepID=UPI001E57911B|nr:hypothetical protein [Agrobacterium vaccinii]UHS56032.1 hypothetical protein HRS00_03990 [Agrobacterium vaccinii]
MYKETVEALDVEVRRALLYKNHYHAAFNIRVKPAGMTAWRRASGTTGIFHQSMSFKGVFKKGAKHVNISEGEFIADWAKVVAEPYFLAFSTDVTSSEFKLDIKPLPIIGVNLYTIERRDEPMILRNIFFVGVAGKLEATEMRLRGQFPTVGPESWPFDSKAEFGIYERRERPWSPDYALGRFY